MTTAALLWVATSAMAVKIQVAESPTTDLSLTLAALRSAKKSLRINAYELTSPEIEQAILDQIDAGLDVEILEEGQPVGGFSSASKKVQKKIVDAMQGSDAADADSFAVMKETPTKDRRFRYDHAKYIVIDESSLLVGSENYSTTGNPADDAKGTRGWESWVHDKSLAKKFATMFASDADASQDDIESLVSSDRGARKFLPALMTEGMGLVPGSTAAARAAHAAGTFQASAFPTLESEAVSSFTSPDTSLDGLVSAIDGARSSLDIELMSINPKWGTTGEDSPLLSAVIRAAKRGVSVRALFNDESVFAHGNPGARSASTSKNLQVVKQLTKLASDEDVSVEARIADVKAMGVRYIHNKGLLIDSDRTVVSSINWNQNSVENNREAAVLIRGKEIHDHYLGDFEEDWAASDGRSRR